MRFIPVLSIALALTAGPVLAADRDETLIDLAGVLGELHALRQACEGPDDQYWRARMIRVLETEDGGLSGVLEDAFNDGYAAREGRRCGAASERAEAAAARRGQALAARLARR